MYWPEIHCWVSLAGHQDDHVKQAHVWEELQQKVWCLAKPGEKPSLHCQWKRSCRRGTALEKKDHCIVLGAETEAHVPYCAGGAFVKVCGIVVGYANEQHLWSPPETGNRWMENEAGGHYFPWFSFIAVLWVCLEGTVLHDWEGTCFQDGPQQPGMGGKWWVWMLMQVEVQRSEV